MIFTTRLNAQSSASSQVTATVTVPVGITKTMGVEMSFGNIAATSTGGTVVLSTSGSRTTTGGITLPTTGPAIASAASFDVSVVPGYSYSISIPTNISLVHSSNSSTMSITAITKSNETTALDATKGTQNIKLGGTLNIAAGQLVGTYSNAADLTVTVNYD